MLETSYAWLDRVMATREWAAGDRFSLADCAAAPFLFYADWTHPIGAAHPNVTAYRQRLLRGPRSRARSTRRGRIAVLSARRARPRLTDPSAGSAQSGCAASSPDCFEVSLARPCDCRWSRTALLGLALQLLRSLLLLPADAAIPVCAHGLSSGDGASRCTTRDRHHIAEARPASSHRRPIAIDLAVPQRFASAAARRGIAAGA